ncbi:hypothetical protein LTR50_001468 [Elasticomyces elasticus]|nr:hypothetical protein LTR50_001468 [Elasticomyces elasticus]
MTSIHDLVEEWLRLDQDESTRAEIQQLWNEGNTEELERRLRKRIAFGTAGLRASMQAGFSRLNSLTVIQTSQGLAAYLLGNDSETRTRGVVIGRDARHNSLKFARLAAAAFIAKGIKVWWLQDLVHTPLVPFAVNKLKAVAGVMITASHNPANDNGYKVYWSNGSQIVPPHDQGIARAIDENLEPLSWDLSVVHPKDPLMVEYCLDQVRDRYFDAVIHVALSHAVPPPRKSTKFVYTPMHGVGLPFMSETVSRLGLERDMIVVQKQASPDPDFPTVKFPNPEEKGALGLAIETANANFTDLIIATDPDADRLAVAEQVHGRWRQLTGNQLGILFASHVLETYPADKDLGKLAMLASTVSSRMLSIIAAREGFRFQETLTGFKWLGNAAQDLTKRGYDAVFAYEEAIGYMFSSVVFDKDGIAAAAVFLTALQQWQQEGLTPWTKLQQLYEKYGYFEDANTYLLSPSPDVTNAVFAGIRALGGSSHPRKLNGRRILWWRDLTEGYDSSTDDNRAILPVDKSSQMISCEVEGDVRFTVRGSGTEPKIKLYIEGRAESAQAAKTAAESVLKDLLEEWFRPESYGLRLA